MPCFKGLAVSIHTSDGPLPEYSIQRQQRHSRIQSYIPVPQPKLNTTTGRAEPASFAISITLLIPGQPVPYSRPEPTDSNPTPAPKIVGSMMPQDGARGKFLGIIGPYIPLTSSINETVAAYIHFDGRQKEEVATLLRRGEETWVNSRWVGLSDSEGGGLAEREFLFREVGLERWLNGLDLKGESHDVAARVERRKRRLEKKRRKRLENREGSDDEQESEMRPDRPGRMTKDGVLRYGEDKHAPVEGLSDDESMGSSDTDPDDEVPVPEAAGQIKVSLFRVLASGEVKKGEYSPQFDAHDDDEMGEGGGHGGDGSADVDHTTTFAQPKTLDPKTISTQTVTGIDPPNKPYATFTFYYRGKKQLQKMGIMNTEGTIQNEASDPSKSRKLDASSLKPLKSNKGTVGFTGYRDAQAKSSTFGNGEKGDDDGDSDEEDTDVSRKRKSTGPDKDDADDADDANRDSKPAVLSAEEISKGGELAEGVKKMQLKRQHSFEPARPTTASVSTTTEPDRSAHEASGNSVATTTPPSSAHPDSQPAKPAQLSKLTDPAQSVGSPFKKQRASLSNDESGAPQPLPPFVGANDIHPFTQKAGGTATTSLNESIQNGASAGETPSTPLTSAAEHTDE